MSMKEKEVKFVDIDSAEEKENETSETSLVVFNHGFKESRLRRRSRIMSTTSVLSDTSDTQNPTSDTSGTVKTSKSAKLHQEILAGNEEEALRIISKGTDINRQDHSGKTPLHTAILSKQFNIVDKLLESGADVTVADDAGDTPLHTAIRVGSDKLVTTLLQLGGCDPNALGRSSCTPLHLAAEMDNADICKLLVEYESSIDKRDDELMTPVARAVERGAIKSAEYLLRTFKQAQGAVDELMFNVDPDGSSLIHLAVNSGVLEAVKICVQFGARIRQPRRSDKVTSFHMACELGSLPVVEYLISEDPAICRITLVDRKGITPLHMAASKNHVAIVSLLLEKGAALDPKCDLRRTPLFAAANCGASGVVALLMEHSADVTIRDVELKTMLHAAVGDFKSIEVLLQSPIAISLITEKDEEGFSPVHYAAKKGDVKGVKLFVAKNRASSSVLSNELDTPIHVAGRYGWTEVIEALMDNQNVRIINLQNTQGKTALHFACCEGHDLAAEALIRLGATIEKDRNDRTPLHFAASKGTLRCCEIILQKNEDCINHVDKNKNTALHLAASNGQAAVVRYLLSVNKSAILMNNKNQNILDTAVTMERKDVVMEIARHERWSEVLNSCAMGVYPVMKILIEKMPDAVILFLDQCVQERGEPTSENYKVQYDLNLVQGQSPGQPLKPDKSSLALIKTMTDFRREACLTHPVTYILLNTKWKTFGWATFALNLLSYFLFVIPLTVVAVHSHSNVKGLCGIEHGEDHKSFETECTYNDLTSLAMSYIVLIMAVALIIKQVASFVKKGTVYLTNFSNYLEWICYISAIVFVMPPCDCKIGWKQEVGAVAIFFAWMNLILYFRRLSSYGQYVIMLTTMFITLFKVLLLWMLFIMAFATTFLMLLDQENFSRLGSSMMTMFVMTLGELNYHEEFMPWENLPFPVLTNVLFVVLVLGMPIIMMNMLVGLAVGDIDKIQQNALMDRYVMQVQLLLDIERSLPMFILKRVQVHSYSEFPNHQKSLKAKVVDLFVSFGKPDSNEIEEEVIPPGMAQIIDKLEQQEKRVEKMYEMIKEQADILKELRRPQEITHPQETKKEETLETLTKFFKF